MNAGVVSISADALRKEFGRITAIDDLSLELRGPNIVGVVGPNGSGKTTFIRCLLGVLSPTTGQTAVNGRPSDELTAEERATIGYMPQREALYEDLTLRENVAFFARLYGVADRETAVTTALEVVGLEDRVEDRVATLSGGMLRRTSLAATIVHEPSLVILDEPTVGLDPVLRASMWETFRDWRDDGAFVLVSTHYLGEARRCDQVCFLRDGRVLAIDSPGGFLDETGADDMEDAFLALLDAENERAGR